MEDNDVIKICIVEKHFHDDKIDVTENKQICLYLKLLNKIAYLKYQEK